MRTIALAGDVTGYMRAVPRCWPINVLAMGYIYTNVVLIIALSYFSFDSPVKYLDKHSSPPLQSSALKAVSLSVGCFASFLKFLLTQNATDDTFHIYMCI